MNEKQNRLEEELSAICNDEYDGDKNKMIHLSSDSSNRVLRTSLRKSSQILIFGLLRNKSDKANIKRDNY